MTRDHVLTHIKDKNLKSKLYRSENLTLSKLSEVVTIGGLGPVQTSCFCRAELNSEIKFDKSTTEARRLNQTFELSSAKQLSSTSSVVLQDSGTAVIQTSCFCRAELNS